MAHILRHLDRGATAIQTGIAEGQDLNYEAFSTSCDGTGPFADAIRDAVGQMLPVIGDGRPVPLPWLWHGGRLLPALVMAAGQETGIDVGGVLRVAQGHDYSLLPRACAEVPSGLEAVVGKVLRKLPAVDGYMLLNPLIEMFMASALGDIEHSDKDDLWFHILFETGGVMRLIAHAPPPPTWCQELKPLTA